MRHTLDASLPDGFPVPTLGERPYEVEIHHVGPEGWTGFWPPEDHALQPPLDWTDSHRILVLDAYNRKWGKYLEEGQTFAVEWPPTAHLWTAGDVFEPVLYTCDEHDEPDCEVCVPRPIPPHEVKPAEWRWQAQMEIYRWEGSSGSREDVETFQFMSTLMDPREVDYT